MAPPTKDSASPPAAKRPKLQQQTALTSFFTSKNTQKKPKDDDKSGTTTTTSTTASDATAPSDGTALAVSTAANVADTTTTSVQDDSKPILPHDTPLDTKTVSWEVYKEGCIVRKVTTATPRKAVAAFDLDGTLLNWRIAPGTWPGCRYDQYELWNSSVLTKLRQLYDEKGCQLVIFSNQGAIRSAYSGKKATFVKSLVNWLAHQLHPRPLFCVMSTHKPKGFHKPSPQMWIVAEEVCNGGVEFDLSKSFYVGDSVGDDQQGGVDIGFAQNVGNLRQKTLAFYTPQDYFGISHMQRRQRSQTISTETPSQDVLKTRVALTSGYLQGPILLVLCGAQGVGKSYFCQQVLLQTNGGWVHLSQDTIRNGKPGTRDMVEQQTEQALREGQSVIVDRMHLDESQRAYFVSIAQTVNVPVHAVVLSVPKAVVAQRVRDRQNHPVSGDKGASMAVSNLAKLMPPKYSEGFALISASQSPEGARQLVNLYSRVGMEGATLPTKNDWTPAVPPVALGTMGMGRKVTQDVVTKAFRLGFSAVDTAPTYNNEDKIGMSECDASVYCIVKVPKRATDPEQVRSEVLQSLSKLKRTHADLLLLHWPSDVIASGSLKEVWQEMEALKKEGIAHSLGVCNFNVSALGLLLSQCTHPPVVNQVERHPWLPQWDLVDFCANHDILLQAHSPLGQGKLVNQEQVQSIAAALKISAAAVLLLWNVQQGVAVVPKCSSETHMQEVLSVLGDSPRLSSEHMKTLNHIKERKRYVAPPFMMGSGVYCWTPTT